MVIKARINVQYLENVEVLPLWAVLRSEPAAVVFAPRAFVGASDPEIAAPQWCAAPLSALGLSLSRPSLPRPTLALTPLASKAGATGTSC